MKARKISVMVACFLAVPLCGLQIIGTADAQEAAKPVVNIKATGEKIAQFGVVIKDVEKTARRFSQVFGTSWRFYDLKTKGIVLHDQELGDAEPLMKVAMRRKGTYGERGRRF